MQARSNGTKRPAMLDYEADCNKSVSCVLKKTKKPRRVVGISGTRGILGHYWPRGTTSSPVNSCPLCPCVSTLLAGQGRVQFAGKDASENCHCNMELKFTKV